MQPYERNFAAKFGPDYHAYGFWKARVALYAILQALDLRPEDELIVPGYTCVVVPNSVIYAGARPIYADILPETYNLNPQCVEKKIRPKTRALLVQHTYGIPADVEAMTAIASEKNLVLIEDCAHVLLGTKCNGRLLGSLGDAAFFSFQWSKPYTTGLGGMAVTREPQLAQRLRQIQAQFQAPPRFKELQLQFQYELHRRFFRPALYWWSMKALHQLSRVGLFVGSSNHQELMGDKPDDFNWMISAFQQRAGLAQLDHLDRNGTQRDNLRQYYLTGLRKLNWQLPEFFDSPDLHLLRFPLAVRAKSSIIKEARRARVEIGSWFDSPMHPLTLHEHKAVGYELGSCPVAESAARQVINLPMHDRITLDEASNVMRFIATHTLASSVKSTRWQTPARYL